MNRFALGWIDAAMALEEQNAELRREAAALRCALWLVLVAAAKRDAHFAYARDLIETRFREAA